MEATFEIFPSANLKLENIPEYWSLTITATQESLEPTLQTYRQLNKRQTPHISAALVNDEEHLNELIEIIQNKVFLIGGDLAPVGPYERSAQLIPHFTHCESIGVAGYPEPHPSYPDEAFGDDILLEKQRLGATYAATQMAFDPQNIIDWIARIRDKGIELPVYCGIAAPISVPKLTQFAIRCGVNSSLNFIKKMSTRDVAKMIQRYDPTPLMEEVYEHVDGFHIYTFNAIKATDKWVRNTPWLEAVAIGVD